MERSSFKYETLGSGRKITTHLAGFNLYRDLVLAIHVEVRQTMLTEEHADDDAENREISGISPGKRTAASPNQS